MPAFLSIHGVGAAGSWLGGVVLGPKKLPFPMWMQVPFSGVAPLLPQEWLPPSPFPLGLRTLEPSLCQDICPLTDRPPSRCQGHPCGSAFGDLRAAPRGTAQVGFALTGVVSKWLAPQLMSVYTVSHTKSSKSLASLCSVFQPIYSSCV